MYVVGVICTCVLYLCPEASRVTHLCVSIFLDVLSTGATQKKTTIRTHIHTSV